MWRQKRYEKTGFNIDWLGLHRSALCAGLGITLFWLYRRLDVIHAVRLIRITCPVSPPAMVDGRWTSLLSWSAE